MIATFTAFMCKTKTLPAVNGYCSLLLIGTGVPAWEGWITKNFKKIKWKKHETKSCSFCTKP